jgi:hypothetical protein
VSDSDEVQKLLDQVGQGNVTRDVISRLMQLATNPAHMERILKVMKEMGLDQIEPLADIGDYYVKKPGGFALRWPLSSKASSDVFGVLDRKSQFFVLFTEWSVREVEATQLLNQGDASGAEAVYRECLARAEQIEVAELIARSYEGLMRVAQRLGQSRTAVEWSRKAEAVRTNAL